MTAPQDAPVNIVPASSHFIWGSGVFWIVAAIVGAGLALGFDKDVLGPLALVSAAVGLMVIILRFGIFSIATGSLLAWTALAVGGVLAFG